MGMPFVRAIQNFMESSWEDARARPRRKAHLAPKPTHSRCWSNSAHQTRPGPSAPTPGLCPAPGRTGGTSSFCPCAYNGASCGSIRLVHRPRRGFGLDHPRYFAPLSSASRWMGPTPAAAHCTSARWSESVEGRSACMIDGSLSRNLNARGLDRRRRLCKAPTGRSRRQREGRRLLSEGKHAVTSTQGCAASGTSTATTMPFVP